ncbi:MAG: DUF3034 family protein [Planctomycetes bacterium]|nr:DUF3034 family protein [Planctomycetota bacterium]
MPTACLLSRDSARVLRIAGVLAALAVILAGPPGARGDAIAVVPAEAPDLYLSPQGPGCGDLEALGPGEGEPAQAPTADAPLTLNLEASLLADPAVTSAAPPPEAPAAEAAPPKKGPPLPLYTVEGTGGALICPMAYLVNPGPPGTVVAPPSAGYTFVKIGNKTVQQVVVTETFFRRIELGYAFTTLDLGDFTAAVQRATGIDINDHVVMHGFNIRGLLIEEGKYCPAITGGASFKYAPTVQNINKRLFGGVRALGMERANGTDFTLTASKMFPGACFGRPVITTGGIRFSQGAQLGLLGFADAYRLTGEGSVCVLVTDWLGVVYEFRQKKNPYDRLGRLVGKEDNWHTVCLAFLINEHLAVACGWGHFGNVVNNYEPAVWGFQVKYEF